MLQYFSDHWGTLLIGVILLVIVVGIVVKLVRDKRRGRTSCGCGCENCPSSGMCHKQ